MVRNHKENPPHAVLFQLEISYNDGSEDIVCSDSTVKTAQGPVVFSDLYAGEKYDANLEIDGWDIPGFSDDGWLRAKTANSTRYALTKLIAQIGPPVRPLITLPAAQTYTSPKGEKIVDFGQNIAGRVRMKLNVPKGTEITLDHFEAPDKDGNYFNNIFETKPGGPLAEQRVVYISNGKPVEFEALFTFQGFRYVRVTGLSDVRAEDFSAVVLTTDNTNLGTFECSDKRLNRLYENIRWSQRSNMVSIPTDCPQREKAGWTGDAQVYAATAMLNEDMTGFFTRWMHNVACEQAQDGRIPVTVPHTRYYLIFKFLNKVHSGESGLMDGSGWGDAATIIPYTMYLMTGNTRILQDQYASMKLWCDYVIKKSAKRGNRKIPREIERYIWNTGYHFGEWMIPSVVTGGYHANLFDVMKTTVPYIAPIFGWNSLTLLSKSAALLGNKADADYYGEMADKVKDAFAKGVITKDGDMPVSFQGAYVMPLYFDFVPEEHKEFFANKLVSLIRENGNRLDTGFLATPFLLDTLCKIGREDVAYELLYQETGPSWLDQIKRGATSIWESWYCYDSEGNPLMMSMNHYAFGCIADWMFRYIGGVERDGVGFKHIKIHPRPDPSLCYAKRSYICEYGEIVCNWERKGGKFLLSVTIPCNTTATVVLPDGTRHDVGSGSYEFVC
jgi:alpha-L-rhamnosidase